MKQESQPWIEFAQRHRKGERLKVVVSRVVNDIGLFCDLESNVFGIVHLSDIDWRIEGQQAVLNYTQGDKIEVMVLSIDPERQRVSLGIKQLKPRPDRGGSNPTDPSPVPVDER